MKSVGVFCLFMLSGIDQVAFKTRALFRLSIRKCEEICMKWYPPTEHSHLTKSMVLRFISKSALCVCAVLSLRLDWLSIRNDENS